MKTLLATAALTAGLFTYAIPAQAQDGASQQNERRTERLTRRSPLVGTHISRFTTDTIGFPGTPDFPCEALIGNPSTPFVTSCTGALVTAYFADGTLVSGAGPAAVLNIDADDNLSESELAPIGDSVGNWFADSRSSFQARGVSVLYNPDNSVNGFRVTDSRAQANTDGSSYTGTFDSRTYFADQDPLDVNEVPATRSAGTFVLQRIE